MAEWKERETGQADSAGQKSPCGAWRRWMRDENEETGWALGRAPESTGRGETSTSKKDKVSKKGFNEHT